MSDPPSSVDSAHPLEERFLEAELDNRLSWFCPPPVATSGQGELRVEPAKGVDFWQKTHYGFQPDNGHFLHAAQVRGDFVVSTSIKFSYVHQYDQAGLMVRLSASCWIKTCIEKETPNKLGVVVTNAGYSDWSTTDISDDISEVELRIRREGTDCIVDAKLPGQTDWRMIRMTHLLEDVPGGPMMAGLFVASPIENGMSASFQHLTIAPGRISS